MRHYSLGCMHITVDLQQGGQFRSDENWFTCAHRFHRGALLYTRCIEVLHRLTSSSHKSTSLQNVSPRTTCECLQRIRGGKVISRSLKMPSNLRRVCEWSWIVELIPSEEIEFLTEWQHTRWSIIQDHGQPAVLSHTHAHDQATRLMLFRHHSI